MWPNKDEAVQSIKDTIDRAKELDDKNLESWALGLMGIRLAMDGEPYEGNKMTNEAEKIANLTGKFRTIASARSIRAHTERWTGQPRKTIELSEGLVETFRNGSNIFTLTNMIAIRGIALAEIGRVEEGINLLKYGIEICENFGAFLRLGVIYNNVGYCYGEIYQPDKAWPYNKRSETIARNLIKKNPMGVRQFSEIKAQSKVNLMENLFDQGKIDEAWEMMKDLEEESKTDILLCFVTNGNHE